MKVAEQTMKSERTTIQVRAFILISSKSGQATENCFAIITELYVVSLKDVPRCGKNDIYQKLGYPYEDP